MFQLLLFLNWGGIPHENEIALEFALPGGVTLHGRDEIRPYIEAFWKAFPDGKLAFGEQMFAEDAAATETMFIGTHTCPIMTPDGPFPPTGNHVTLLMAAILKIKDGRSKKSGLQGGSLFTREPPLVGREFTPTS